MNRVYDFETVRPEEIEARSFEIIGRELGGRTFPPEEEPIVRRVIHATADFDFADSLTFSSGAVAAGLRALLSGCLIITDTNMARAGISSRTADKLGSEVRCFMAEPETARMAKERGITRAAVSMERAAELERTTGRRAVFAIGNAPTALIRLCELHDREELHPLLVVGVPVGFVNVIPAKEMLLDRSDIPSIVARGRKGGSTVAAAVMNALLYMAAGR
jgi:precorrin-8X/cobalt-precorrin-8 methylmutase